MTRTSTTILGAIALALFAFIVLYERQTMSTAELRGARNQLLERFVRTRVDGVEIERDGEVVASLRREREEGDMLGTWRVVAPFEAAADDDAVSSMLGAVQYAAARRTLEDTDAADLERFGLTQPRLVARFQVANETLEVRFGGDDPTGAGVYMATDEVVHVVGRDVFEALDHDAGHFRSKRLVDQGVLAAKWVVIRRGESEVVLSRAETGWRVAVPGGEVLAAMAKVEESLSAFNDLEAERFEGDELGEGFLVVEATTEREGRDVTTRLQIGEPCGERGEERMARVDDGPFACVLASRLDPLLREATDYREDRPVTISDLEVGALTLALDGVTLAVTRDAGAWKFSVEGGRRAEGEADDEAFAAWLREIRQARATAFAPADALEAYGLTRPRGRMSITDTEGTEEVLEIGAASTEGLFVRRAGEAQVLVLPAAAEALFEPGTLRLRATRLWEYAERDVKRVTIARGSVREVLARDERGFVVEAPVQARADRDRSAALARSLARLDVSRFVAETPSTEHGLASPRYQIEATIDPDEGEERTVRLRIGAATEGGAFAQIDGDSVVVVLGDELVGAFDEAFVDRGLFATPLREVETVRVQSEGRERAFTWDGQRFLEGDEPLDERFSDRLASVVEGLRASHVGPYGAAASADGVSPGRLTMTVTRGEGIEPRQLVVRVGAPTGTEATLHARRDDLRVGAAVAETAVAVLFELMAP
ncbi:MAG: DUF4340 domain-containing protein [Sandaracinus sp.]|nr:DUF4340 domain-containing protein [Sandaracinus sp.]MCB9634963.1 DUF4340 domain-containing protein [Sandaracinus sp.]